MMPKNSIKMNKKERKKYNEYMRKYQKQRYHICADYRKTMLEHSKESYKKGREKILLRVINYFQNPKIKAYKKEYDHLIKYVNAPRVEIEKEKRKLRKKYGIRQTIRCDV